MFVGGVGKVDDKTCVGCLVSLVVLLFLRLGVETGRRPRPAV